MAKALPAPGRMLGMVRQARAARFLACLACLAGLVGFLFAGFPAVVLGGVVAAALASAKPPPE